MVFRKNWETIQRIVSAKNINEGFQNLLCHLDIIQIKCLICEIRKRKKA